MINILIALVLALSLAGGAFFTSVDAALPGESLYSIDRQLESIRLSLTKNPASQTELLVEYTQERLDEIQALAQKGDVENLSQAISALGQDLLMVSAAIDSSDLDQVMQFDTLLEESLAADIQQDNDNLNTNQGNDNDNDNEDENQNGDEDDNDNEEEEGDSRPGTYCDSSSEAQHPVGLKLAEELGSDYETIMGWFCQGYGFGEITLAYKISEAAGISVEEVFEKRASGMGWGQIMKEYGLIGKDKPKPEKGQGKPEKTPKPENPGKGKGKGKGKP